MRLDAALAAGRLVGGLSRGLGRGSGTVVRGRVALAVAPDALRTPGAGPARRRSSRARTASRRPPGSIAAALGGDVATNTDGREHGARDPHARSTTAQPHRGARDRRAARAVGRPADRPRGRRPAEPHPRPARPHPRGEPDLAGVGEGARRAATSPSSPTRPTRTSSTPPSPPSPSGSTPARAGRTTRASAPAAVTCSTGPRAAGAPACGFAMPEPEYALTDRRRPAARRPPARRAAQAARRRQPRQRPVRHRHGRAVRRPGRRTAAARLGEVDDVDGRYARLDLGGRPATLFLAKNPAGWAAALSMIDDDAVLAVGINARIADGTDTSWLYDVPFERLAGRVVGATGDRARPRRPAALRRRDARRRRRPRAAGRRTAAGAARRRRQLHRLPGDASLCHLTSRATGPSAGAPQPRPPGRDSVLLDRPRVPAPARHLRRRGQRPRAAPRAHGCAGIDAEIVAVHPGERLPRTGDVYLLGGGEDAKQTGGRAGAARRRRPRRRGRPRRGGRRRSAPDTSCSARRSSASAARGARARAARRAHRPPRPRAVGNMLADPVDDLGVPALIGFENHGGATHLGPGAQPLGRVRIGVGNGDGGDEGAFAGQRLRHVLARAGARPEPRARRPGARARRRGAAPSTTRSSTTCAGTGSRGAARHGSGGTARSLRRRPRAGRRRCHSLERRYRALSGASARRLIAQTCMIDSSSSRGRRVSASA